MRVIQRVAKNSLMVVLSTIATKVLSLIYLIFVARYLGDTGFGQYSFVFALLSFFVVFTAFGMDALIIREVAKDKSKSSVFLINSSVLKTLLCLSSWAVLLALVFFLHKAPEINIGILIIGFCLLPDSIVRSAKAIFSGHEKMEYNTAIEVVYRLIIVALGLFFIKSNYGVIALFTVPLCASLFIFVFSLYLFAKNIGSIAFRFDSGLCRYLLKASLPFAFTGAFIAIYHRIDTVMLSLLKGDAPVGWYSAAYGLTESFLFIPAAVSLAAFPVLSKLFKESREAFKKAYEKSFQFLLILAIPVAVGVTILADRIILMIYRPEFNNSIICLRILTWAIALVFLNSIMGFVIYSANRQKVAFITTGCMVLLNIILNLMFIPRYSFVAASATTVATEFLGFISYFVFISLYIIKIDVFRLLFKGLGAGCLMGLFLYYFKGLGLFPVAGLGAVIYGAALFLFKAFSVEDKHILISLISSRR